MDFELSKTEYPKYVEKKAPKSLLIKNMLSAFLVGGLICTLGECIKQVFMYYGLNPETAGTNTTITLIFLGSFLTGINIYDEIGKFAGAGSIVPITGFANSIVSPAMEYKSEGFILGVGAKMFLIAGPVLVYGIVTSVIIGVLYFFML